VVRKDDAGDLAARRQRDLERVPLHLTRDRAGDSEACFRVVDPGRKD
jgi:hypothetical protein